MDKDLLGLRKITKLSLKQKFVLSLCKFVEEYYYITKVNVCGKLQDSLELEQTNRVEKHMRLTKINIQKGK